MKKKKTPILIECRRCKGTGKVKLRLLEARVYQAVVDLSKETGQRFVSPVLIRQETGMRADSTSVYLRRLVQAGVMKKIKEGRGKTFFYGVK